MRFEPLPLVQFTVIWLLPTAVNDRLDAWVVGSAFSVGLLPDAGVVSR